MWGSETGTLARLGFDDVEAAARSWARIGGPEDEELLTQISEAADPDQALRLLADLLAAAPDAADLAQGLRCGS